MPGFRSSSTKSKVLQTLDVDVHRNGMLGATAEDRLGGGLLPRTSTEGRATLSVMQQESRTPRGLASTVAPGRRRGQERCRKHGSQVQCRAAATSEGEGHLHGQTSVHSRPERQWSSRCPRHATVRTTRTKVSTFGTFPRA